MICKVPSKPNHSTINGNHMKSFFYIFLYIYNELIVQGMQPGQKATPERDVIVAALVTAGMSSSLSILASFSVA